MTPAGQKRDVASPRRRYLVHLLCVVEGQSESCHYIARIRPWVARSVNTEAGERAFADECELIATINPLLPRGSDIRDVFDHIESPNGFFYLLRLSSEEAGRLGWRRELSSG
jgi:hypothetical protein